MDELCCAGPVRGRGSVATGHHHCVGTLTGTRSAEKGRAYFHLHEDHLSERAKRNPRCQELWMRTCTHDGIHPEESEVTRRFVRGPFVARAQGPELPAGNDHRIE